MLIMVLLIARMGWLERAVGQDRLVRWHRRIAPWALGLITAHVVLITLGYAQSSKTGALRQLWVFLSSYPDVLAATVGFGLLVMVAVTSVRIARRRLKYETWWVVHLYTYIALALAFAHQIVTGVSFVGHPLARAIWATAWGSGYQSSATSATSYASNESERKPRASIRSSAGDAAWTVWR
jgi:DMSO/TMAO reductase YedYZ heme-binding membrane subunit